MHSLIQFAYMHILLVEDETALNDLLRSNLESEYFVVDTASDGEIGSSLARTNDYDLIILDNVLPRKTGLQVCQELRAMGKMVPILMISARQEADTKVELLNAGVDDYLSKPFSFEELLARIRALLRRPKPMEMTALQIDDLKLDSGSHIVIRGKKTIHLAPKEYGLLEYLMRNEGIVVTRGMILEHVWHTDVDPFSNTIESHIVSLRKKIDLPGKKKLIHTVKGMGYRLQNGKKMAMSISQLKSESSKHSSDEGGPNSWTKSGVAS